MLRCLRHLSDQIWRKFYQKFYFIHRYPVISTGVRNGESLPHCAPIAKERKHLVRDRNPFRYGKADSPKN